MTNFPLSFLKAKKPEQLRALMVRNNREHGVRIHYFSPQFVNGEWYVWFELDPVKEAEKALNNVNRK